MKSPITDQLKNKIIKEVEEYMELKIARIEIIADPHIPNVYAVCATFNIELANYRSQHKAEFIFDDADDVLEEVDFSNWPPKICCSFKVNEYMEYEEN